ncbi:MAG: peptide deformylase [Deltaproteobacteria bacterium]|nr:peptide deformylase [Deltaproteobacteria bacterium]
MALLNILKYPDPFLKTKAAPVQSIDLEVKKLISDMVETMAMARGIGLAATQVGVGKRVVVLNVPVGENDEERRERGKNLVVLVNPEIVGSSGSITYDEGCLSVPGVTAEVERFSNVTVKALDRDGAPFEIKAEGLFAIALQHEIDHLDGILFIDRLSRLKRELIKRKYKKAMERQDRAL